jgi:hypothetical protein
LYSMRREKNCSLFVPPNNFEIQLAVEIYNSKICLFAAILEAINFKISRFMAFIILINLSYLIKKYFDENR